MENTQLCSKNNLFTGNIYQNNDTWINILDETEFSNKVLKMVVFQLFHPTPLSTHFTHTNIYVYIHTLHTHTHIYIFAHFT